jgi:hypothetical protein
VVAEAFEGAGAMSMREGSLLVIDELLMTKAVAETVGASWLAENPYRDQPVGVVYLDAMGTQQFVLLDG